MPTALFGRIFLGKIEVRVCERLTEYTGGIYGTLGF